VKLIVAPPQQDPGTSSGTPSKETPQSAVAPDAASPGSSAPVTGGTGSTTLLSRLLDPANVGPGLLVIAGSLIVLFAARRIRTEQERKAYQRYYSATWG